MNSGYSSPYSVRPDNTPIQQILNTDDQQAKYKEDEKIKRHHLSFLLNLIVLLKY